MQSEVPWAYGILQHRKWENDHVRDGVTIRNVGSRVNVLSVSAYGSGNMCDSSFVIEDWVYRRRRMGTIETIRKMYFIMDTDGHYYQLDSEGQLVMAEGKEDAVFFTYEEADRRIGNGRRAQFYKIVSAGNEALHTSQENVVMEKMDMDTQECDYSQETEKDEDSGPKAFVHEDEKDGYLSRWDMPELADLSDIDWLSYLQNFCYIVANIPSYREQLNQAHSRIDQTLGDLLHYVEFYDLDDVQMREIMDEIKAAREYRRDIKNELGRLSQFVASIGTYNNASRAKEAARMIQRSEMCHYRPRVLKDLFENAPEEDRRKMGCFSEMEERYYRRNAEAVNDVLENAGFEEEGELEKMDMEKIGTVYDGKKVDWNSFVKGQADFFRYAEQHIRNLQIDIANIDAMIEETLHMCESAHFNVAQGYKVFRKLKDLRNERRELFLEMKKVQAIADRFDCDVMRQVYEEIEDEYGLSGESPDDASSCDGMSSGLELVQRKEDAEVQSVDVLLQDAETDIQGIPEAV